MRHIVVTISVQFMCVRALCVRFACVHKSGFVRGHYSTFVHGFQNKFGKVVLPEESVETFVQVV